jgi:hypothetical protein
LSHWPDDSPPRDEANYGIMPPDPDSIGLCATCAHCRVVATARSAFYLCGRSFDDARFRKYPPLPVLRCVGYQRGRPGPSSDQPDSPPESE